MEIAFGRRVARLDLEVKHFTRVQLADGSWALRAGCKVIASPGDLERLVSHFLKELEAG